VLIALGVGACGHAASDINSPGRANATAGFYSVGGNGSTVGSASIVGSGDTSASFAGGSRDRHRKRCWAIGRHHRPLRPAHAAFMSKTRLASPLAIRCTLIAR